MSISAKRFRIGYALAPKKVLSFIQPSLVDLAKQRGVDLVPIDVKTPLVEQGTFDCVIHKMYGEEWKKQLDEFSSKYPNAMVIDPLDAIERVHNRVSMLQVVNELEIDQGNETFGIPKQILIHSEESLSDPEVLEQLSFPVIAKPLVADGSAKSHKMSLLFNTKGLKSLSVPVVLQEFVNHGGVIFKVYVAGNHVKCVKRRSLPDISEEKLKASESAEGLLSFSQISNLATQDKSDDSSATLIQETQRPPSGFVIHVANGLRKALRLHLFNFDMIRDKRVDNGYLVIDINYFPGYAKMPDYETVLTDFFLEVVHPKHDKDSLDDSQEKSSACKE